MTEKIDMRPLKERAMKIGGTFMKVVVSQPDSMSMEEYLMKAGDWLRLLEEEQTKN